MKTALVRDRRAVADESRGSVSAPGGPGSQLSLLFDEDEALHGVLRETAAPTLRMPTSPRAPAAKRPAKAAPPAKASKPTKASGPSEADSLREAERLTAEGLHLRWAHEQRRMKLMGPLDFVNPKPSPAPAKKPADLVPTFLKRWPDGWRLTEQGFVHAVDRPDAKVIARLVNARRDELGVYFCEKVADDWRFVIEF